MSENISVSIRIKSKISQDKNQAFSSIKIQQYKNGKNISIKSGKRKKEFFI